MLSSQPEEGKGREEEQRPSEELGKALQNTNRMSQKSLFSPMTFYSRRSDPRASCAIMHNVLWIKYQNKTIELLEKLGHCLR